MPHTASLLWADLGSLGDDALFSVDDDEASFLDAAFAVSPAREQPPSPPPPPPPPQPPAAQHSSPTTPPQHQQLRCLDVCQGPPGECACTAAPRAAEADQYELVGDPGKKNGDRLLRAAVTRTPEWGSVSARKQLADTVLNWPSLEGALRGRRASALHKPELLAICHAWGYQSSFWQPKHSRAPRRGATAPTAAASPAATSGRDLLAAVECGDVASLRAALARLPPSSRAETVASPPSDDDPSLPSPLLAAARAGCLSATQLLVAAAAAAGGDAAATEERLSRRCSSCGVPPDGPPCVSSESPLLAALWRGHASAAAAIHAAGGGLNVSAEEGAALLRACVASGDGATLAALVRHGVPIDAEAGGSTALHAACASGDAHMATLLAQCGAARGAVDAAGRTPPQVALASGHADIAALLSQLPATPCSWCQPLKDALHAAAAWLRGGGSSGSSGAVAR